MLTGLTLSASAATVKPRKKKAAKSIRACADRKTGRLRLSVRGRPCNRRERIVVWNVRGPRGARGGAGAPGSGTPGSGGPPGSGGAPGDSATARSIFTARAGNYLGVVNPAYAAVTGATTVDATESLMQTLAPSEGFVASSLVVRALDAPGVGSTLTVTLREDGADTELSCTIAGTSTTCSSSTSTAIAGASAISLEVSSTGTVAPTSLLVGFEGR
jgi:hypothetical protein